MSPIDRELEQALADRAGGLTPPGDLLAGVEREARGIRRRRTALTGAAALSVLAIAVAVPLATRGDSDATRPPFATQPPTPSSPSASPTTAASPGGAFSSRLGWAPRGNTAQADDVTTRADDLWQVDHSATLGYAPLWRGTLPDGRRVAVVEAIEPNRSFAVFHVEDSDGSNGRIVHGFEIEPRRWQVSAYVDGPQDFIVIVGAPTTGQLEFSTDGRRYTTVDTVEGTGVVAVTKGDDPKPYRVRVYDGDGVVVYDGPVDLVSED